MKIENLKSERKENWARVAATVTWEDCNRPTREIYFETTGELAEDLLCNPDAFLLAAIVPAMHHGEKRIAIDAEVCPELQNGLQVAMRWILHWYRPNDQPIRIEAKARKHLLTPDTPQRAGFFFSGGIDSLSTLRANHLSFPPEHPGFIKEGLLIHGFNFGREEDAAHWAAFKELEARLSELSQQIGLKLLTVQTNIRHLDNQTPLWSNELQGAALSSVAHTLARRLTVMSLGSTYEISNMQPKGSHPLLDPNYSSYAMRIRHDGTDLSRLAKTKLVADWDVALQQLRVCDKMDWLKPGMQNCCKCEKCVRTMTALLALGKLEQASTFPVKEVSKELLDSIKPEVATVYKSGCYQELIAPLAAQGRTDLVRSLEQIVTRFKRRHALKQLDRRLFNGDIRKLIRSLTKRQATPSVQPLNLLGNK